jgi:hypothetical protein
MFHYNATVQMHGLRLFGAHILTMAEIYLAFGLIPLAWFVVV